MSTREGYTVGPGAVTVLGDPGDGGTTAKPVPGVHRHSQLLSLRRNDSLYLEEEGATCPSKALQVSVCDRLCAQGRASHGGRTLRLS